MLPTYPANLRDQHIEWTGDSPPTLGAGREVPVHVTLLEQTPEPGADRGKRMAAALKKLADSSGLTQIPDPVGWEREQREERELPGRES